MSQFIRSNRCYHGRPEGACIQCGNFEDLESPVREFPQPPCIICNRELEPAFSGCETNQPYGATSFITHGHYGSTIFDPLDGSYLEINICDDCLAERVNKILIGYSGVKNIHKPLKPWSIGNRYHD